MEGTSDMKKFWLEPRSVFDGLSPPPSIEFIVLKLCFYRMKFSVYIFILFFLIFRWSSSAILE